jgi:hypothetical protein
MVFNHGGNGSRTFVQLGSEPRPVPWQTMATAVVGCVNRAAPGQFQGGAKLKAVFGQSPKTAPRNARPERLKACLDAKFLSINFDQKRSDRPSGQIGYPV